MPARLSSWEITAHFWRLQEKQQLPWKLFSNYFSLKRVRQPTICAQRPSLLNHYCQSFYTNINHSLNYGAPHYYIPGLVHSNLHVLMSLIPLIPYEVILLFSSYYFINVKESYTVWVICRKQHSRKKCQDSNFSILASEVMFLEFALTASQSQNIIFYLLVLTISNLFFSIRLRSFSSFYFKRAPMSVT